MASPGRFDELGLALTKHKYEVISRYLRLLIGLSLGAVVLMATLLSDLFREPVARPLLLGALISFALCVLFSMFSMSSLTEHHVLIPRGNVPTHVKVLGSYWVNLSAEIFFLLGFILLAIFVVYNFWVLHPPSEPSAQGPFFHINFCR